MAGTLSARTNDALFQRIHQEVSGRTIGPGAWQELERVLASMKARNRPRIAKDIEAGIQRARDGEARVPQKPTTGRIGSRERAEEAFGRARDLMRVVHAEPFAPEAAGRIKEARRLLDEAVDIARRKKLPHLPDFLISLGNAWKMPPDEDVERALGIYEKVGRRDLHPEQQAKLWKVQGDALRHRGRPEDLRLALDLLVRSARERTGWLRAEALLNAAGVARIHPDLDEDEQIVRAVALMMDAVRADAQHVEDALRGLLMLLGDWKARSPADDRPDAFRAELRTRYPHRAADLDRPARLPPRATMEHILATLKHPASQVYMEVACRLMRPQQMARDPYGIKARLGRGGGRAHRRTTLEGLDPRRSRSDRRCFGFH
jgi:tetratricopeptide (TPR) repeat protein